jgi:hypothetical protein
MKTVTIILCLFILSHSPSFVFADADPANPKKQESPCGFTDDMNCLENGTEADATVINANFKYLTDKIKLLENEFLSLGFTGSGRVCIFADRCPNGWTHYGKGGFIVHRDSSTCPFSGGASYNKSWYWCHPQVCCND